MLPKKICSIDSERIPFALLYVGDSPQMMPDVTSESYTRYLLFSNLANYQTTTSNIMQYTVTQLFPPCLRMTNESCPSIYIDNSLPFLQPHFAR